MFFRFLVGSAMLALGLVSSAAGQGTEKGEPYAVVHGWPQLPDGFVLGQVSGVAVDSHNHVFVFHRAENSWATDKTHVIASPTVLCFEGATGKLLFSWGQNRFIEPHGLRIDREDNVWLTDRALQQVFKFSHDGKLLFAGGSSGLTVIRTADLTVARTGLAGKAIDALGIAPESEVIDPLGRPHRVTEGRPVVELF